MVELWVIGTRMNQQSGLERQVSKYLSRQVLLLKVPEVVNIWTARRLVFLLLLLSLSWKYYSLLFWTENVRLFWIRLHKNVILREQMLLLDDNFIYFIFFLKMVSLFQLWLWSCSVLCNFRQLWSSFFFSDYCISFEFFFFFACFKNFGPTSNILGHYNVKTRTFLI